MDPSKGRDHLTSAMTSPEAFEI